MLKESKLNKFIRLSTVKHSGKYTYEKAVFVNVDTKLIITCPMHGDFTQTPYVHRSMGCGCPDCGGRKRSTTEKFIIKATSVHGDKFDYSKANYISVKTPLEIVCTEHGSFWQRPHNHLSGAGCPYCAGIGKSNTERFISSSLKKHGDRYDYSLVSYNKSSIQVNIICKIHGVFKQTPNSHLQGQGCSECGGSKALTLDSVNYRLRDTNIRCLKFPKNARSKGDFVCSCGNKWSSIVSHIILGESGCPKCAKYGFKTHLPSTLYLIKIDEDILGFGITNDFKSRFAKHQKTFTKFNVTWELIAAFEFAGNKALEIETGIKRRYNIIDIGIPGFRRESTNINNLPSVLDYINSQ